MKIAVPFLALALLPTVLQAQERSMPLLNKVRVGTLEINDDYTRRYVFRWDGAEEVFDMSPMHLLKSKAIQFPGLPNLELVGVRTKSGRTLYSGPMPFTTFAIQFSESHPNEEMVAFVFRGLLDKELIVQRGQRTPVCRIEVANAYETETLWANVSSTAEVLEPSPEASMTDDARLKRARVGNDKLFELEKQGRLTGMSIKELEAQLGKPTRIDKGGQIVFYRFDSGLGGWDWTFEVHYDRITLVTKEHLD